ncbi:MAG: cysteine desulfurase [Candidatus Peribacteraceae bacterium]|nr:cysteine desulfurase [Candidatus Peribacteraceae bacterium]
MSTKKIIYLDHAATTPLAPEVLERMLPYLKSDFGNAGSIHTKGQSAKNAVESARRKVAEILWCEPQEIIFTSGGSESDNLALRGTLKKGDHLIISAVEHPAVLQTAEALEKEGVELTKIPVERNGILKVGKVQKAIRRNTTLISIMLANNEIGTLQPVREIGKFLQKNHPEILLHTDAVQAGGILNLDVRHLKVDLLSLSAHKFYGPKGIGVLFAKSKVKLKPQISGGHQENGIRAGTENVAGIVGAAAALDLAEKNREKESIRITKLRDYFIKKVLREIPKAQLNGDPKIRLPGNANFSFYGVEGESILLRLDFTGIAASTGSACASGSLEPSYVLQSLKIPHEWLHGSIRFSLGKSTGKQELDQVVTELKKIIRDLRELSPLFE